AILVADTFGSREHLRPVRIAHDLHQTLTIAQVDEDHAPVIAPAMNPAVQVDRLADEPFVDQPAVFGSHSWPFEMGAILGVTSAPTTPSEITNFNASST